MRLANFLFALLGYAHLTLACTDESTAYQYLKAIEAADVPRMGSFMAEDIHYFDPTMTYFGIPAVDLNNRKDTMKFWSDSFRDARVARMNYEVTDCFAAGATTVMTLQLTIDVAGSVWGVDNEMIQLGGTHIMSLEFAEGGTKIKRQTDYVDYADVTAQVEALKEKFGALVD